MAIGSTHHSPNRRRSDIHHFPTPFPPAPVTPEGIEGYKNWARFMVEHFKGRVAYREIYNEPVMWGFEVVKDWDERVKADCDLVKAVVPVIHARIPTLRSACRYGRRAGAAESLLEGKQHPLAAQVSRSRHGPTGGCNWLAHSGNGRPRDACLQGVSSGRTRFPTGGRGAGVSKASTWRPKPGGAPPTRRIHSGRIRRTAPSLECRVSPRSRKRKFGATFVINVGLNVIPFWCNTWIDFPQNDGGLLRPPGPPIRSARANRNRLTMSCVPCARRWTVCSPQLSTYPFRTNLTSSTRGVPQRRTMGCSSVLRHLGRAPTGTRRAYQCHHPRRDVQQGHSYRCAEWFRARASL